MNGIWTVDDSKFSCNIEWLPGSGDEAIDYWTSKGDMRRNKSPAGYLIEISVSPQDDYLLEQLHSLIRKVRLFKGPPGPWSVHKDLTCFWKTRMSGQEKVIFEDVRKTLVSNLSVMKKNAAKVKELSSMEAQLQNSSLSESSPSDSLPLPPRIIDVVWDQQWFENTGKWRLWDKKSNSVIPRSEYRELMQNREYNNNSLVVTCPLCKSRIKREKFNEHVRTQHPDRF